MLSRGGGGRHARGSSWKGWRREWAEMPQYLKLLVGGCGVIGGTYVASHVETMPMTGRRRVMFLSPRMCMFSS